MTDQIKFSVTANRAFVPVSDTTQLIYILLALLPKSQIRSERLPLNFCLVLDRSGSMLGEKLRTMKEAVIRIIDQLDDGDYISVVTFESRTDVLVPSQPVGDKKQLIQLVDGIQDGGGTNLAAALSAALQMVSAHSRENEVRRIILLTDGEATDRQQDSMDLADEAGSLGIPIICLGFGEEWNVDFLFEIADRSIQALPGSHIGMADYIPAPEDAEKVFQDAYQSMKIVALDASLKLRMAAGVEARRIWRVTPSIQEMDTGLIDGRLAKISIGQLEQSGAAFLFEILVPPRIEGAVRIAQAIASYCPPDQNIVQQIEDLVINYSSDPDSRPDFDENIVNIVEKVQAFKLQTQALEDAQTGDIGSATRKLRQAVTILLMQGEDLLADQMTLEADRLEQSGEISSKGKKTIMLSSRKTVRLSE